MKVKFKFLSLAVLLGLIPFVSPAMAEWVDISGVSSSGQVTVNGNGLRMVPEEPMFTMLTFM